VKNFFYLLFIFCVVSCSNNVAPTFKKADNIVIKEMTYQKVTLESDLNFYNPNRIGGQVKAFDIEVVVNDINVGKAVQKDETKILAKQDFIIPTTISFPPKKILGSEGLMKSALQLFANEKANVHYSGIMTITVAGIDFDLPVDFQEEIPLKRGK